MHGDGVNSLAELCRHQQFNERFESMSAIRQLTPLLKLYPRMVPLLIVVAVAASIFEGFGVSLFIPLLQDLGTTGLGADPQGASANWLSRHLNLLFSGIPQESRLYVISGLIFGSILIRALLTYANAAMAISLSQKTLHRIRTETFSQLLDVSYQFIERTKSGDLVNTLHRELQQTVLSMKNLINMFVGICLLVMYVCLLLLISWQLTLVVALSMFVISLFVQYITRRAKQLGKRATQANMKMVGRILEGLSGMKVIRAFAREDYERSKFDQVSANVSKFFFKANILSEIVKPIYEIISAVILVVLLLAIFKTPSDLGPVLVFIFVLFRVQPRIIQLDRVRVAINANAAAVEATMKLWNRKNKQFPEQGSIIAHPLAKEIRFENVSFCYEKGDKEALSNVSVRIPEGKVTALVGPSGAGKSTLIKLLLRLYEPTSGTIYVDGTPLSQLNSVSWRNQTAMVSQDIFVFNRSIRENIAYGRLDATDEDVIEAAKLAGADEFVQELPDGYDTIVGDRGVRLSGGQQQRLTLARAIVRKPRILILDEATNALDSITEERIQRAIEKMSEHCTVISIAHRFSTIENADQILVFEDGLLRDQGSFQDLQTRDSLFSHLHALQYRRSEFDNAASA